MLKHKLTAPVRSIIEKVDPKLASVFVPWALKHPRYMKGFARISAAHLKTKKLRKNLEENGVKVPPFMILSVTSTCNLSCSGCYASATMKEDHDCTKHSELGLDGWKKIISEACDCGVMGFVIAGGEPFMQEGIIEMCTEFKDRLFIIVTNGTTLTGNDLETLSRASNIAVLVSIEGDERSTNIRRGKGVHDKAVSALEKLAASGVPTGISATVTRDNFEYWMEESSVSGFIEKGATIAVFIEKIPIDGKGEGTMLTNEEKGAFRSCVISYRENLPVYVIHSPGDEEFFGGCVSAGKGFVHVTPTGNLTACPVSDVSVGNVTKTGLSECLKSGLFRYIRENHSMLETGDTPCALFGRSEELKGIAEKL